MTDMVAFRTAFESFYANYPQSGPMVQSDILAEDVDFISCGDKIQLPWADTWQGLDGMQAFLNILWEHVEITRFDIVSSVVDEFGALYLSELDMKSRKTGETITLNKADSVTVRDGKVVRYREVYDVEAVTAFLNLG
jgi:ketosteroid isomerase-like protein